MNLIQLVKYETRKIWQNKVFIISLAVLLIANAVALLINNGFLTSNPHQAYSQIFTRLSAVPTLDKAEYIDREYNRIKALYDISVVLRSEAYEGGIVNNQLRDNYKSAFELYYELYLSGQYLTYTDSIDEEYAFISNIKQESDVANNYVGFLDSIDTRAESMSTISIFGDHGDNFSLKNIKKTISDYTGMDSIHIDFYPQKGIQTALDFTFTNWACIFSIFFLSSVLVRVEKNNGMLKLIKTTANGIGKTAVSKLLSLFISLLVIAALFYIENLLICNYLFGLGAFSRSIQSLPFLMTSTFRISVGSFLLYNFILQYLGLAIIGLTITIIMLCAKDEHYALIVVIIIATISFAMYLFIPATGKFNVPKYVNLVGLVRSSDIIGKYHNLYLFDNPISLVTVMVISALIIFSGLTLLFYITFSSPNIALHDRRVTKKSFVRYGQKCASVFGQENYKLYILNGALIILIVYAFIQAILSATTVSPIDEKEIYRRYYLRTMSGELSEIKYEWFLEQKQEFQPIFELNAEYESGLITEREYNMRIYAYSSLVTKMGIYEEVQERISYVKNTPDASVIYDSGWKDIFNIYDTDDFLDSILLTLVCILSFSGYYAKEYQTGVIQLLSSTPLGKGYTAKCKMVSVIILSSVTIALSLGARLYITLRDYGLPDFFASANSIPELNSAGKVPLAVIFVLLVVTRLVAVIVTANLILLVSLWSKNTLATLFITSAAFLFPFILSVLGFGIFTYLSIYPLVHSVALLMVEGKGLFMAIYSLLCITCWVVTYKQQILRFVSRGAPT